MNLLEWLRKPRKHYGPKVPRFWGQSAVERDAALAKAEAKRERRRKRNLWLVGRGGFCR